jgi:hypothetical protein
MVGTVEEGLVEEKENRVVQRQEPVKAQEDIRTIKGRHRNMLLPSTPDHNTTTPLHCQGTTLREQGTAVQDRV